MKNSNALLFGSIILILLAVGLVAILDRTSPSQSSDIRARAGTAVTLKLIGTVDTIDESKGTITASGVHFASSNLSGEVKDLGTFTITPPAGFNYASISVGGKITVGLDAKSFDIPSHTMTAITLVPGAVN